MSSARLEGTNWRRCLIIYRNSRLLIGYEVSVGSECAVAARVVRQARVLFACISVEERSALGGSAAIAANAVSKAIRCRCDCSACHYEASECEAEGQ